MVLSSEPIVGAKVHHTFPMVECVLTFYYLLLALFLLYPAVVLSPSRSESSLFLLRSDDSDPPRALHLKQKDDLIKSQLSTLVEPSCFTNFRHFFPHKISFESETLRNLKGCSLTLSAIAALRAPTILR